MEIKTENENLLDYSIVKSEYSLQEIQENNILAAVEVKDENEIKEEPEEQFKVEEEAKTPPDADPEDPESFNIDESLAVVLSTKGANEIFPCCVCGETFKNERQTRQHIRTHFKSWGSLKCRKCGKVFKSQYNLTYHNLVVHSRMREAEVMGRKYTCKDCGKGFYSKDRYEKHLTVHSNVRKFQCSLCSNSFKLGLSLDQHLRFAHSSERPFSCTVCPGTFKYKQGLMQHMKSHERKLSLGSLRPCLPEKTEGEGINGQISIKSEAN
ncbi:oocyte zinc finger protein XlCOF15-like [Lutzomyia longipalpis]|uniref:oocyte zinc finger protein XlCOF15-like n=1 Tax=Lutzomyia longipalpis TaxID=7200 RepID=UPI00248435E8|nr:oocyte zinc finger protein XlCOF15-like [Lutzomyia longipalpis]